VGIQFEDRDNRRAAGALGWWQRIVRHHPAFVPHRLGSWRWLEHGRLGLMRFAPTLFAFPPPFVVPFWKFDASRFVGVGGCGARGPSVARAGFCSCKTGTSAIHGGRTATAEPPWMGSRRPGREIPTGEERRGATGIPAGSTRTDRTRSRGAGCAALMLAVLSTAVTAGAAGRSAARTGARPARS
jgi:hypothetical protein